MRKFRESLSSGNRGFTLIEVLVVIAVIGILASIAIPRLGGVTNKAKNAEFENIGGSLRSSMELYNAQEGKYPDLGGRGNSGSLLNENYLGQFIEINIPDELEWGSYSNYENDGKGHTDGYAIKFTNQDTSATFTVNEDGVTFE